MGPCAGSAFSRIPKGGTHQFLVNVAFAANKTFINGRGYRLRMPTTAGVQFKVGFNGPLFAGPTYGVPNAGDTGAWVTAQTPQSAPAILKNNAPQMTAGDRRPRL